MLMFSLCTASRASVKGRGAFLYAGKILKVTQAVTLLLFNQRITALMGKMTLKRFSLSFPLKWSACSGNWDVLGTSYTSILESSLHASPCLQWPFHFL